MKWLTNSSRARIGRIPGRRAHVDNGVENSAGDRQLRGRVGVGEGTDRAAHADGRMPDVGDRLGKQGRARRDHRGALDCALTSKRSDA